ncbi:protein of unknown function [Candidatus Methylomirabilis oxygeniifera]|uniref:Uncharacterized protein n=1 Tax=Methylomirabilis oxygeniifera TaxID=671143 RepID=D5MMD1_METO1|nr:protein of unknown function [Candidatus Methylomirabilis oxyfera]
MAYIDNTEPKARLFATFGSMMEHWSHLWGFLYENSFIPREPLRQLSTNDGPLSRPERKSWPMR